MKHPPSPERISPETPTVLGKTASVAPLLKVIRSKILVWLDQHGMDRVFIARPELYDAKTWRGTPQTNFDYTVKMRRGRPVPAKGPRDYGNRSLIRSRWVEDGLSASRAPMMVGLIEGRWDFQIGDIILHCREGDFILLPAGTPYANEGALQKRGLLPPKNCTRIWLSHAGIGFGLGCWMNHQEGHIRFEMPAECCYITDAQSIALYEALVREAETNRLDSLQICEHIMKAMWQSFYSELKSGSHFQFAYQRGEDVSAGTPDNPIDRAQEYIRARLQHALSIEEVATAVYLSRASFTKQFRAQTNRSFHEFLTACRLEEATRLLKDTDCTIKMISWAVGLTPSRFRAVFQTHYGCSPLAYRRHSRTKSTAGGTTTSD